MNCFNHRDVPAIGLCKACGGVSISVIKRGLISARAPSSAAFDMRKLFPFLCLMAWVGCAKPEVTPTTQLLFKGMELNSWRPAGKEWHFSLLPGRNWRPLVSEITSPEHTIVGVQDLKTRLSDLSKGESVIWHNLAKEPVPTHIKKELEDHSRIIGIQLHLPTP